MTRPTRRRVLALAAAACGLAALGRPAAAAPLHRWDGVALGADVTLTVRGGTAPAARAFFAEAARALRAIEARASLYRGSDLVRLNALGRLAHPAADLLEMLRLAGAVHAATGGAFDPTVQPLWQARRLGIPEAPAAALAGWGDVRLAEDEIRLARPGMALTLNGLAQGFAADRLAEVAARHGLTDVLIDTGEARALGPTGWPAEVQLDGAPVRRLALRDRALATSAPFGTRIGPAGDGAHILAADGRAVRWRLVSVSADRAALADALSTAAVLLDEEAQARALAAFPGARIEARLAI